MKNLILSFTKFSDVYKTEIYPIYAINEESWDNQSVYSNLHACRTTLFGEAMMRHYIFKYKKTFDITPMRVVLSMHEAARKSLIDDGSVNLSKTMARSALIDLGFNKNLAYMVSDSLTAELRNDYSQIAADAILLDSMRPCFGKGGIFYFKKEKLYFISEKDTLLNTPYDPKFRENFINASWRFITETEDNKEKLLNRDVFSNLYTEFCKIDFFKEIMLRKRLDYI